MPKYLRSLIIAATAIVAVSMPARAQDDPRGEMETRSRQVIDESKKLFNEGNQHYKNRKYPQAVVAYQGSIDIKPEFPNAHFGLGMAYQKMRKFDQALASLDQALVLKVDYHKALLVRARVQMDKKNYSAAVIDYEAALALKPQDPKTFFNLALANQRKGDKTAAIAAYEAAVALKPSYTKAHKNLGLLYEKQGDTAKAARAFGNACRTSRSDASACAKRAEQLNQLGKFEQAEKAAQLALDRKPGYAHALVTLGEALEGQRLFAAAVEQYRKAAGDPTWGPTATYKIEQISRRDG